MTIRLSQPVIQMQKTLFITIKFHIKNLKENLFKILKSPPLTVMMMTKKKSYYQPTSRRKKFLLMTLIVVQYQLTMMLMLLLLLKTSDTKLLILDLALQLKSNLSKEDQMRLKTIQNQLRHSMCLYGQRFRWWLNHQQQQLKKENKKCRSIK